MALIYHKNVPLANLQISLRQRSVSGVFPLCHRETIKFDCKALAYVTGISRVEESQLVYSLF